MKISSVFAAVLLASVSSAAVAADLPSRKVAPAPLYAAPVFTWTGFYIGLNAGGVIGKTTGAPDAITANILFAAPALPTINSEKFGFLGGGQIGFNYQMGGIVVGLEADIDLTTVKDSRNVFVPTGIPGFAVIGNTQAKLDYLATIRGRLGYTLTPNLLGYVTGGLALGGGSVSAAATLSPFGFPTWAGSASSSRIGWTIGGGAEYALNASFSVKGEYLYYNLGSTKLLAVDPLLPSAVSYNVKRDGHVFRLGVNYRFGGVGGPVVAKY